MKFIEVDSVRGLEINEPVYVKVSNGAFTMARLIKEEKTKIGIKRTWQIVWFTDDPLAATTEETDSVTHVCIPK